MMMLKMEASGNQNLEELEIELLLEGIWRRYGVDLREYDRRYIRRRVLDRLREERLKTPSQLLDRVLRKPEALEPLVDRDSETQGSLFRPARAWKSLRRKVMPLLRTYPSVRAWAAGCIPHDAFSLLLVLEEELSRGYTLYATATLDRHLDEIRLGNLSAGGIRSHARYYAESGGRKALSNYLDGSGSSAVILPSLLQRIVFSTHDFASDASFNAFQVIVARSTLRRYNATLRARSLRLIHGSLVRFGFLMLGAGETLDGSAHVGSYAAIESAAGLYQKIRE